MNEIYLGDNLPILRNIRSGSVNLIYIDPPFNTGEKRVYTKVETKQDDTGNRLGFKGKRYRTTEISKTSYDDVFPNYIAFLRPRLIEAKRVLAKNGTICFHGDQREIHAVKIFLMDAIFGQECFLNEIIWAYDYGGRGKDRWPNKHQTILVYVKDPENYVFNYDAIERIPYMAPGLVGPEKAAKGKVPTDVWWHTIVPTSGPERTGYPTQKPLGIIRRLLQAHSNPGDTVLDFFAGSGTIGAGCQELKRKFILIDSNKQAYKIMQKRLGKK